MMKRGYWSVLTDRRIRRRHALAVTGGTALGTALLASCGGGSDSDKGNTSALITQPVDTSKEAKRGGVANSDLRRDLPTLEPTVSDAAGWVKNLVYTRLLQELPGYLKPQEYDTGPELAESWEWSPDGLQLTLKLRPGVKWHNKPPVNGRLFDVEDAIFSWERFARIAPTRTGFANAANPSAPILSFTAPDAKTIVVKLKQPVVYVLNMLAFTPPGAGLNMVPKESDSTLNLRNDMIGTGPFVLSNYTPSVGMTFKRNPDFYDKDRPYVDQLETHVVSEYATALAQFTAGNLHTYDIKGEDTLTLKRQVPDLGLFQSDVRVVSDKVAFGYLPGSPFHDERVRQAVSHSLDRETWIDAFYNVSQFESEGLPVETRWHSHLESTREGWWLNPRGKDFGPNAAYFQHDVAKAKKLLAAAGFPNGMDVVSTNPAGTAYGIDYPKQVQSIEGMLLEAGFRTTLKEVDYTSVYIPQIRDGLGRFEGWTHKKGIGFSNDALALLVRDFHPEGSNSFFGFDAAGKGDGSGDPQVTASLEKAMAEFDTEKRRSQVFDIQRYLAKKMYYVFWSGGATGFLLAWPALKNFNVFRGGGQQPPFYWWVDNSLPPFRKA